MKGSGAIVVAGVGAVPMTRDLPRPAQDLATEVAFAALDDAGLAPDAVDGIFLTPPLFSSETWLMHAAAFGEHLGLRTRSLCTYENGGMTSLLALRAAWDALALGRVRTALVVAADTRPAFDLSRFESFARHTAYTVVMFHGPINGAYGVGAPVPLYAMSAQRYMHEFGWAPEDVARVAVTLRGHAAGHPWAQFRTPLTVEDVLASPVISPPIHLQESSSVSSGACALVLARAEDARPGRRVRLKGWGEHHHPSHFLPVDAPLTRFEALEVAGRRAFEDAGVRPADIDVAEVYGVFAATELIAYEDLGFFPKGRAPAAVAEGRTTFGGDVVLNPSGGRLSLGHPAGATPLYEVAEIALQLRGEAKGRQAPNARLGLAQAEHGVLNGAAAVILEGE